MPRKKTDFGIPIVFKNPTSLFGLMCIYKMSFSNGYYYIGATTDFGSRVYRHIKELVGGTHTSKVKVSYINGSKVFFEIIEFSNNRKDLPEREQFHLKRSVGLKFCMNESIYSGGLNKGSMIGSGLKIAKFTERHIQCGIYDTQAEAAKSVGISVDAMSNHMRGFTKHAKGVWYFRYIKEDGTFLQPPVVNKKEATVKRVSLVKMDLIGNVLLKFKTISEAAEEVGISRSEISRHIRGEGGPIKKKYIYVKGV